MQEKHFLYYIAKGYSIQAIALFMGCELTTVKNYRKQLLKKLEYAYMAQAVLVSIK